MNVMDNDAFKQLLHGLLDDPDFKKTNSYQEILSFEHTKKMEWIHFLAEHSNTKSDFYKSIIAKARNDDFIIILADDLMRDPVRTDRFNEVNKEDRKNFLLLKGLVDFIQATSLWTSPNYFEHRAYEAITEISGRPKIDLLFYLLDVKDMGTSSSGSDSGVRIGYELASLLMKFDENLSFNKGNLLAFYKKNCLPFETIEKYVKQNGMEKWLAAELDEILHIAVQSYEREISEFGYISVPFNKPNMIDFGYMSKIEALIADHMGDVAHFYLEESRISRYISIDIKKMSYVDRNKWSALFHHLNKASEKRPSEIWIDESSRLLNSIGVQKFETHAKKWLETIVGFDVLKTEYYEFYIEEHFIILCKGLLWFMTLPGISDIETTVRALSKKCFKLIEEYGDPHESYVSKAAESVGAGADYYLEISKSR